MHSTTHLFFPPAATHLLLVLLLPPHRPPPVAGMAGMIMWPKAKRAVSDETAAAIAAAAREGGAQAVGVFVDEDAATITARCRAAGIGTAQLHGDASRAALNGVPADLQVVYVLQADDAGQVVTPVPGQPGGPELQRPIDWLLLDGMTVRRGEGMWAEAQPAAAPAAASASSPGSDISQSQSTGWPDTPRGAAPLCLAPMRAHDDTCVLTTNDRPPSDNNTAGRLWQDV